MKAQSEPDPESAYNVLESDGKLHADPAQREVLKRLQLLHEALKPAPGGLRLPFIKKPATPRSLYIWGDVGRGKSMLMDLFFHTAPTLKKRRIHFHAFMQEVHESLHRYRKERDSHQGGGDPVARVVADVAASARLLCFDELQAEDVADASILFRLFDGLFDAGVTVVSTSNRPPESLYQGGVQAERFDKFTELLKQRMDILALDSPHDYRRRQIQALRKVYHTPLGLDSGRFIEQTLATIAHGQPQQKAALHVKGRELILHRYGKGIAAAAFAELCEAPLGPADYLEIARAFSVLILRDIPVLTPEKRNEAKRFVILIDTLYEHKVKLICTAAAPADRLYPEGDGSFAFQRTVSRLMEMQSERYLNA